MSKSRECKFKDLAAGSWFIMDGEIYQKDDEGACVKFSDGFVSYPPDWRSVEFIESIELIYD